MTNPFYLAEPQAYCLESALREPAKVSAVRCAETDELPREEILLRKLGARGWGRVYQFRNYYGPGWGGAGRVLSPKALDAFSRFVEKATFPAGQSVPSVFLTDQGGIELCWEDQNGKPLQVEFSATGAEFYNGGTGEEGVVTFAGLDELHERLSA